MLGARLRYAAAREYQWRSRAGDDCGRFLELFPAGHDARHGGRVPQLDIVPLNAGLGRDVDHNGAGAACAHLPERLGHGEGDFPGREHLPPPLGHRAQHVGLVRDFVIGPKVLADLGAGYLAGNEEHGRGAGVRGRQTGGSVVHARARDHQHYPRLSRRTGIAVGHVRGALLMASRNHADARLVPYCGQNPGHMYAGNPEHDLDPFPYATVPGLRPRSS